MQTKGAACTCYICVDPQLSALWLSMSKSMSDLETVLLPCGKVSYPLYTAPVLIHSLPAAPTTTAADTTAAAAAAAVPSPPPATTPPLSAQATIHTQTDMPLESKPFEMYHQLCCTGKCVSKSGVSVASSRRCPNRSPLERRYCGWANSFPTPCPIDADEIEMISYHAWQAMLRKRGEDGGPDYYAEELVPIRATRAQFITAFQGFVTTYLAHVWECRAMRQGLKMFEANKDGVTATKLTDYAAQVRARRCARCAPTPTTGRRRTRATHMLGWCNPTTHTRALHLLPPLSRGPRSARCSACTLPPARPR